MPPLAVTTTGDNDTTVSGEDSSTLQNRFKATSLTQHGESTQAKNRILVDILIM